MFAFFKTGLITDKKGVEEEILRTQLSEIDRKIVAVRSLFASVNNEDLIEAYVFELGSLEAKRSFLIKRAKELEIKREPFKLNDSKETAG